MYGNEAAVRNCLNSIASFLLISLVYYSKLILTYICKEAKMKLLLSLILFFTLSLSSSFAGELDVNPYNQAELTLKLETFKSLVERNLSWRAKTTLLVERLKVSITSKRPFRARDLRELSEYTIPE